MKLDIEIFTNGLDTFEHDPVHLTPREFEEVVRRFLAGLGEPLTMFEALHDHVLRRPDGDYQIDVYVTFQALGADIKVLIECKHHQRPVEQEVVQVLHDKLARMSAHKGMVFSTNGFQSGVLRYAKEHGIACVHVMDGKTVYMQKGLGGSIELPPWAEPVASRLVWIEDTTEGNWSLHYDSSGTDSSREMLGLPRPLDQQ